jgi:hypothetical protein
MLSFGLWARIAAEFRVWRAYLIGKKMSQIFFLFAKVQRDHPPPSRQTSTSQQQRPHVAMKRKVAALEKIDADLYVNCENTPRLFGSQLIISTARVFSRKSAAIPSTSLKFFDNAVNR